MKKYLCFLLSITLVFTMAVPAFSAGIEERDLLDYMFIKNVIPDRYSVVLMSLLSNDSDDGIYTLRSADEIDSIVEDVEFYLYQYGVTAEELRPYVTHLYEFFVEKPDLFTVFCGFMLNEENVLMPMADQDRFEQELPNINSLIRENFYCETFFLNLLSRVHDEYYSEKNDAAFIYYNDEIRMKSDAMDYVDFFENNDSIVISCAQNQIENMLSVINGTDFAEKSAFVEYMILMGIMSPNMDEGSAEEEPVVDTVYDDMAKSYALGTEDIKAFYTIDSIIAEYVPLINAQKTQSAKNKIIYEAMSKAATLKVVEGKDTLSITDSELVFFAALSAQRVRNKLVENNINVSRIQPFSVKVLFEDEDNIKLSIAKGGVSAAKEECADKLSVVTPNGSVVVNLSKALENDAFGSSMIFEILYGDAETVIPSLSKYAQGNKVYKIKAGNGNLDYDTAYFEKDVTDAENLWEDNKVYKLGNDGERELVNNYILEGSKVSFEIGDGQYFTRIDGELDNFEEAVPTPTPTVTPTPVTPPSDGDNTGSEGGNGNNDYEDEEGGTPVTKPSDKEPSTPTPTPGVSVTPSPALKVSFSDVTDSHWAKSYIEELASKGILSGVGNNMFKPDDFVTREQFAKILAEAFGIVNDNAESDFADVEKGSWYEKYVATVYAKGIATGIGENMFGIGQNMTRQDMAVMIVRAAKALGINLAEPSTHSFNDDGKIADYAKEAVSILISANVVSGFEDNTFRPTENCTRAQVAKIVSAVLAKGK